MSGDWLQAAMNETQHIKETSEYNYENIAFVKIRKSEELWYGWWPYSYFCKNTRE